MRREVARKGRHVAAAVGELADRKQHAAPIAGGNGVGGASKCSKSATPRTA